MREKYRDWSRAVHLLKQGERVGMGYEEEYNDRDDLIDGVGFAQSGSALRAATKSNPRNLPCPHCHKKNRLTRIDVVRGYQCDECAEIQESGAF